MKTPTTGSSSTEGMRNITYTTSSLNLKHPVLSHVTEHSPKIATLEKPI